MHIRETGRQGDRAPFEEGTSGKIDTERKSKGSRQQRLSPGEAKDRKLHNVVQMRIHGVRVCG